MTKTPQQIQEELSAPFVKKIGDKTYPDLRWKPDRKAGNDKMICIPYIDRTLVINRLNEVLGIDGWQFEYIRESDGSKTGSLSIKVDDKWYTRMDTGTEKTSTGRGMTDKTEKEKASTSDALKRCATQFGVGTYINDVANVFIDAKMNTSNKLTPCDKNGRFLYGSSLHDFCNNLSTAQGYLAQLLRYMPDLYQRDYIQELWEELKIA